MRTAATVLAGAVLFASPLAAQDRRDSQGIPPGHLPPPRECRVWYDGRPPGQQPPPTNCREAERIASHDRYARVIYGGARDRRDDRWGDRGDDQDRGRAVPRGQYPYPEAYPYPAPYAYPDRSPVPGIRGRYGYGSVAFDNGYKDGFDKGRADGRDRDAYDPVRHSRYRSADRGYDRRYGSKDQYKDGYRDGFRAGYDQGYRDARRNW
jgi:hypothetical protein